MTTATIEKLTFKDVPSCSLEQIEFQADDLDIAEAVAAYRQWGALVVRGLNKPYAERIRQDVEAKVDEGVAQLDRAQKCSAGWSTPNGCLFIPAPEHFDRDKQVMTVPMSYRTSGAFHASAMNPLQLDLVEAIIGPDVELFHDGQCLCKEPCGGHPKNLHQDFTYFLHRFEGPVAILSYAQDTTFEMGALHVVPGSHKLGELPHIDSFSHLALDPEDWPWSCALPIPGGAGDAIFFHLKTIHGSQENHSNLRRSVFIHRYRHVDDFVIAGGHNVEMIAKAKEKAEMARKEGQEGLLVRGYRPYPG